ncbi:hypothetical protein J6500_16215 [Bradyrhizobium sp. WSM 1704]|uniref:hypothetical protein n=1 Tax=Bradyrhizobium semiaridum TaxID=2821404 RepID=UPI001CE34D10|nr:hypothetical protein [Bradyrhizobium semiaridum]MCA6123427.1 hypothetical protein [Bradyrhizobium semiaridum]
MTDAGHTPPDPPAKPASAAEGCLSMLMFLGGAVLLLPAICTLMASGKSGLSVNADTMKILLVIFAVGLAGAWLIWLGVRPRKG